MRHLQSPSHFRLSLCALQCCDGYVDTLLAIAREQASGRTEAVHTHPQLWLNPRPRKDFAAPRSRLH